MFSVACQYLRLPILSCVFLDFKTSCARVCLWLFFVQVAVFGVHKTSKFVYNCHYVTMSDALLTFNAKLRPNRSLWNFDFILVFIFQLIFIIWLSFFILLFIVLFSFFFMFIQTNEDLKLNTISFFRVKIDYFSLN